MNSALLKLNAESAQSPVSQRILVQRFQSLQLERIDIDLARILQRLADYLVGRMRNVAEGRRRQW